MYADEFTTQRIMLLMKLRNAGVNDTRVLSAIEYTDRAAFVPDAFRDRSYEDCALPIASGQTISQPSMVAWMTMALEVNERSRVLEVGTGSGYQAAILSRLCRMVYTIERHDTLRKEAEERFKAMELKNIITLAGDGSLGWGKSAPYDRILVTAAATEVPAQLIDQLAPGGILIIPVGPEHEDQLLLRIRKTETGIDTQHLMYVRFVPLVSENQANKRLHATN